MQLNTWPNLSFMPQSGVKKIQIYTSIEKKQELKDMFMNFYKTFHH